MITKNKRTYTIILVFNMQTMNNKYAKYMVFALQIHNGIEENVLLH